MIRDVGPAQAVIARHPTAPVTDLGAAILAPGLVDTHCHLEWSLAGGMASGPGFGRWLEAFVHAMGPRDIEVHRAAAALGVLTAVCAGTTTLCDSGPHGVGAEALTLAGVRGVACVEAFGDTVERAAAASDVAAALRERAGTRVRVGISPHAPYSTGPGLWAVLAATPALRDACWTTHLAESADEVEALDTDTGPLAELMRRMGGRAARWPGSAGDSPTRRLAAAGVLRPGLVVAHAVMVDAADAATLAVAGVHVAHCPISNARLGCGAMPLGVLEAAGVVVGLGTDSPASAGAYDVRAEARAAQVVHGAAGEPPSAERLLRLATLDGARVLGTQDRVGSLEVGKCADMVAVTPPASASAGGDPADAFLRADAHVRYVWVDGEQLVCDGRPTRLDAAAILARAAEARGILC